MGKNDCIQIGSSMGAIHEPKGFPVLAIRHQFTRNQAKWSTPMVFID